MFCIRCGTVLPDDSRFCSKCGISTVNNSVKTGEPPKVEQKYKKEYIGNFEKNSERTSYNFSQDNSVNNKYNDDFKSTKTFKDYDSTYGCGYESSTKFTQKKLVKKERNGFVTFLLVLMICFNIIVLFTNNNSFIDVLLGLNNPFLKVQTVIYIVSAILLLCWKKIGFWAIVVIDVIGVFIMANTGSGIFFWLFMILIKNVILYGTLNIRKNGVSAWDYLDW